MTDLTLFLDAFHFLRPWVLVLLAPAALLWWRMRRQSREQVVTRSGIAAHLADALTIPGSGEGRLRPVDSVFAVLALAILAVAGPTWQRVPDPLQAKTAPLVVVMEVTESMTSPDIPPSRLERSRFKVLDLLGLRSGARTALVAYAGSAHRVTPLTEDPDLLKLFLESLDPDVMPADGANATAALSVAEEVLAGEDAAGAILFVLDGMDRADLPAFQTHAEAGGARVILLNVGANEQDRSLLGSVPGATVVDFSPDDEDVRSIERQIASAYREGLVRDERLKWDDRGWLLIWPAVLLMLVWFRRGWTLQSCLALAACFALGSTGNARADGIADWFLTPDQQGRLAYQKRDYERAADLFTDAMWRGQALLKLGRYEEAAQVFGRLDTSAAAFAQGIALIRSRGYRPAVAAYERALELDPDNTAAARNLEIAKALVVYVERAREEGDTGEETGIGADDVVYDNRAERGADTTKEAAKTPQAETAEQWMRTVDTRTGDFLRMRFRLEAARTEE